MQTQQQRNNRRRRANPQQLAVLWEKFLEDPKPDQVARESIGKIIDMTPRSVQIWFQNTRAKKKQQDQRFSSYPTKSTDIGGNKSRICLDRRGISSNRDFYSCRDYATSMPLLNSASSSMRDDSMNLSYRLQSSYPHSPYFHTQHTFSPVMQSPGAQSPGFQSPGFQSPNLQSPKSVSSDFANISFLDPIDLKENYNEGSSDSGYNLPDSLRTKSTDNLLKTLADSYTQNKEKDGIFDDMGLNSQTDSFNELSQFSSCKFNLKLNTRNNYYNPYRELSKVRPSHPSYSGSLRFKDGKKYSEMRDSGETNNTSSSQVSNNSAQLCPDQFPSSIDYLQGAEDFTRYKSKNCPNDDWGSKLDFPEMIQSNIQSRTNSLELMDFDSFNAKRDDQSLDRRNSFLVIPCTHIMTREGIFIHNEYNEGSIRLEYYSMLAKIRVYFDPACFAENDGITRVIEGNIEEILNHSEDMLCLRITGIADIMMTNCEDGELFPLDPFLSRSELLLSSEYTFYGKFSEITMDEIFMNGCSDENRAGSSENYLSTNRLSLDLNNILDPNQLNPHNLLA